MGARPGRREWRTGRARKKPRTMRGVTWLEQWAFGAVIFALVGSSIALYYAVRRGSYFGVILAAAGMILGGTGIAHAIVELSHC